ncbi:MAG: IgGFc-binding protein [Nannocystaceae bacterium]|nr:IgGFc-binding protein [Nannocystaceae bacterium]
MLAGLLLVVACSSEDGRADTATSLTTLGPVTASGTGTATQGTGTSGPTSGGSQSATDADDTGGGPIFDIGTLPDAGGPGPTGPVIPETCKQAEDGESSVGCVFYAVDMDSASDSLAYAIVTANVQTDVPANVSIQTREGGVWTDVQRPVAIAPLSLNEFMLPDRHQEGTGVRAGGAYRIVSDVPIVAYQFSPIDGASSFLSDASMLYPVPTLDSINHVISTNFTSSSPGAGYPYVTIVGTADGTVVQFTATNATTPGGGIQGAAAGQTITIALQDGDVAQIVAANEANAMTGSRIVTDDAHPVAVLSGHTCINIPSNVCCCDHLEEQLSGVRQWGQNFVAAHMPVRSAGNPEATFWQVYASEDGTTISFDFNPALSGLPGPALNLDAGMVGGFMVTAPVGTEADFGISATKPIAVVGYMVSAEALGSDIGDPAMAQYVAVEQFLPRYVVLVPGTWINDVFVLTRSAGAPITIDGVAVDDTLFEPVGAGTYEVARVPVPDGVHVLDGGDQKFGVVVVGYDQHDSYAYIGGTGTGIINPNPEG